MALPQFINLPWEKKQYTIVNTTHIIAITRYSNTVKVYCIGDVKVESHFDSEEACTEWMDTALSTCSGGACAQPEPEPFGQ
jgi:hypothetical protein